MCLEWSVEGEEKTKTEMGGLRDLVGVRGE